MNIDEYRALKAQVQQENVTQPTEQPPNPTPPETPPKPPENPNPNHEEKPNNIPNTIHIDGIGEITVDELRKGYLRNKDYTQKTQEVSKQRKEAEEAIQFLQQIKENPQILQEIANGKPPQNFDPLIQKILELEATIYDMKVDKEIETLQRKYEDFDVREAIEIAQSKKLSNLEDAYLLSKSAKTPSNTPNVDELKQQIRKEVLQELEADANVTRTIIAPSNDGTVYEDKTPKLSEEEKKVARNMFRKSKDPYAEYAKWKNAGT